MIYLFHPVTYNLFVFLNLKYISCRQRIAGSCFLSSLTISALGYLIHSHFMLLLIQLSLYLPFYFFSISHVFYVPLFCFTALIALSEYFIVFLFKFLTFLRFGWLQGARRSRGLYSLILNQKFSTLVFMGQYFIMLNLWQICVSVLTNHSLLGIFQLGSVTWSRNTRENIWVLVMALFLTSCVMGQSVTSFALIFKNVK